MKQLFVSNHCVHCRNLMAEDTFQTDYADVEIIDITESMANLKQFLAIRDTHRAFEAIKKAKKVGIPVIYDNGEITFPGEV